MDHLPEIDDFTFPPPSGRIMQEEKKRRREGRAGIEKEGKGRAGFPRHFGGWAGGRLIKQLFPHLTILSTTHSYPPFKHPVNTFFTNVVTWQRSNYTNAPTRADRVYTINVRNYKKSNFIRKSKSVIIIKTCNIVIITIYDWIR